MADMNTSINIPVVLIEAILSKSPLKSIVRFKSVCKLWNDIISDPQFYKIHHILQTSKKSEKQNLFVVWMRGKRGDPHIGLVRFKDGILTTVSSKTDRYSCSHTFVSSCKGLFLLLSRYGLSYMLWNPSIQKSTTINMSPAAACYRYPEDCHLYHDESIDDYKIVFVYKEHYTIYSCKNQSWGEMLDFPSYARCWNTNAFIDGCLYRICNGGVTIFDFRDGKLSKLIRLPGDVVVEGRETDFFGLGVLSGRLCLWSYPYWYTKNKKFRLWVMENYGSFEENCWRLLIDNDDEGEEERRQCGHCRPLSLSNEDASVVIQSGYDLLIYNPHQKGFQKIDSHLYDISQYEENPYMPS